MLSGLAKFFGMRESVKMTPASAKRKRFAYDAADPMPADQYFKNIGQDETAVEQDNPEVRKVVRNRVRSEVGNNCYMRGVKDTFGEAVIGSEPHLKYIDPNADRDINRKVETAFQEWADGIGFGTKMRNVFDGAVGDGESFLIEITTSRNKRSPVPLDYRHVAPERCTSVYEALQTNNVDGVLLDDNLEVKEYTFLKNILAIGDTINLLETDLIHYDESKVIHYFKRDKPEQYRGMSELVAAVPLCAYLRSWSLATIQTARMLSSISGVIQTNTKSFDDDDSEDGEPYEAGDLFQIETNSIVTLPEKYEFLQVKASDSLSKYAEFKHEIIGEIARCIGMPLNVALGTSQKMNFASGKLDLTRWDKLIKIRQKDFANRVLYKIFARWFSFAKLSEEIFDRGTLNILNAPDYKPKWSWYFDGSSAIDPSKEASSNRSNLEAIITNHQKIASEAGEDYLEIYDQAGIEKKQREERGIEMVDIAPPPVEPAAPVTPATKANAEAIKQVVAEMLQDEGLIG